MITIFFKCLKAIIIFKLKWVEGRIKMCFKQFVFAVLLVCGIVMVESAQALTLEDLEKRIEKLEQENTSLKMKLGETDEKINTTADALEAVAENASQLNYATDKVSLWFEKSHLGGYGEMHYNNLDGESGAKDKDEIDFHRFVLFFGHDFNDKISFFQNLSWNTALQEKARMEKLNLNRHISIFN